MILKFFDYVYYRIYSAYTDWDNNPEIYAISLVALMQLFNFGIVVLMTFTFLNKEPEVSKHILYASYIVFLIPNYIRYKRFKSYKQMDKRWGNAPKKKKILGGIAVLFYLIMSLVLLFVTGYIYRKIKNG
ncbi:hypothetical protein EYV94_27825 [Puteibacter caeruleilacunae]|nr:hypothetical protein EYV94_27825 [Puteibacter caeruleilacunae]